MRIRIGRDLKVEVPDPDGGPSAVVHYRLLTALERAAAYATAAEGLPDGSRPTDWPAHARLRLFFAVCEIAIIRTEGFEDEDGQPIQLTGDLVRFLPGDVASRIAQEVMGVHRKLEDEREGNSSGTVQLDPPGPDGTVTSTEQRSTDPARQRSSEPNSSRITGSPRPAPSTSTPSTSTPPSSRRLVALSGPVSPRTLSEQSRTHSSESNSSAAQSG